MTVPGRLLNAAVLNEVNVRDGHVVDAAYKEPFDLLFTSPKFECGDAARLGWSGLVWWALQDSNL